MHGKYVMIAILVAIVGTGLVAYCLGAMQSQQNWQLRWDTNSPAYLIVRGQACPECGERQSDRAVLVGSVKGTLVQNQRKFTALIATELYQRQVPHELVKDPNLALRRGGAQGTQIILSEDRFAGWCRANKLPKDQGPPE